MREIINIFFWIAKISFLVEESSKEIALMESIFYIF